VWVHFEGVREVIKESCFKGPRSDQNAIFVLITGGACVPVNGFL
jgi:hypothetical protein